MSSGWNFTQVTSGAVHTSDNNQANLNENGLNQVTPGGAPANNFTLPASLNMNQVQVSRQFTMGTGSPGNSVDQHLQSTRGVSGTMATGAAANLVGQHLAATRSVSGRMGAGAASNLITQHQVTRSIYGTMGGAPPPNLVNQNQARSVHGTIGAAPPPNFVTHLEARHGVN